MALITCPECGKQISDSVKQCIHCGKQIIICPECKAPMSNFASPCPSCGFTFSRNQESSCTAPPTPNPKKKEKPTKSAIEVYEDFKKTSIGYKVYNVIKLVASFLVAFAIVGVLVAIMILIFPGLFSDVITSSGMDLEEMLSRLSPVMAVLMWFMMGAILLLGFPFWITDQLIFFFCIKKRGFKINKTLEYLNESKGKKKNGMQKIADNIVWLEIFSLCDKPSFILYFVSFVYERIMGFQAMAITMSLVLLYSPNSTVTNIVYNTLEGILQSRPPYDTALIISFILSVILAFLLSYAAYFLAITPALVIKGIVKQRKQVILSNWQTGIITIEEIDPENEAEPTAYDGTTNTTNGENYNTYNEYYTCSGNPLRPPVEKAPKSKLEKFFPMLKFNTTTGNFILGLILNVVFTIVSLIILVIIFAAIGGLLAIIPIIGIILDLVIVIPLAFIIAFTNGSYWSASFVMQIVMFCKKRTP